MSSFEDFIKSRKQVDNVMVATGLDPDSTEPSPGFLYLDSCYVGIQGNGEFNVAIGNTEESFENLDDAEQYLWDEWASVECQ